jgi:5-formyltetrahydrofolate cyclo-ligase
MLTESLQNSKNELRQLFKDKRARLSQEIKTRASTEAVQVLSHLLPKKIILSFAPLPDEIDLWKFNESLAKDHRLVLPKIKGKILQLCLISSLSDLTPSHYGLWEPHQYETIHPEDIHAAIIPGLAFDSDHHRLGYGGGYYDRLLKNCSFPTFGIGFKEQLSPDLLPVTKNDVMLDFLLLF